MHKKFRAQFKSTKVRAPRKPREKPFPSSEYDKELIKSVMNYRLKSTPIFTDWS